MGVVHKSLRSSSSPAYARMPTLERAGNGMRSWRLDPDNYIGLWNHGGEKQDLVSPWGRAGMDKQVVCHMQCPLVAEDEVACLQARLQRKQEPIRAYLLDEVPQQPDHEPKTAGVPGDNA